MTSPWASKTYDERVLAWTQKLERNRTQQQFEELVALTLKKCEKKLKDLRVKGVVHGRVKKIDSLRKKLKISEDHFRYSDNEFIRQFGHPRESGDDVDSEEGTDNGSDGSPEASASGDSDSEDNEDYLIEDTAAEDGGEEVGEDDPEDDGQDVKHDNDNMPSVTDWISSGKAIHKHAEMGDLAGLRIGLYFPNDIAKVVKKIQKRFLETHRSVLSPTWEGSL